jgi:phosphatidylserine/phosphatidylglycerophosphate/cardiolipin synthase-like enzyme
MPTEYINHIYDMLAARYPQPNALWNYSTNNTLATDWLKATPTSVWGLKYDQFRQAVPDENGPLHLKTCTVPGPVAGTTELCQAMDASMTALDQTPDKLLIGHSDAIVDAMYDVAKSAEVLLDVTSLSPPTGRFLDALNNAVRYLASKPADKRPVVRILVSNPLPNSPAVKAEPLLRAVTNGLDPSTPISVYVFIMSSYWSSWNHAKIVAADGVRAVVGGHNQWGIDYLGSYPAHDVSMRIDGPAAKHAQDFADSMWVYGQWYKDSVEPNIPDALNKQTDLQAAWLPGPGGKSTVTKGVLPATTMYGDATPKFASAPAGGSVPVLAVGRAARTAYKNYLPRLDDYETAYNEPSDDAIIKMVTLAKSTVRMSLQSFRLISGYAASFNFGLIDAIVDAMKRGVDFYVVISNPGAPSASQKDLVDAFAPYDGDKPGVTNGQVRDRIVSRLGYTTEQAEELIAQRWNLAQFRYSADQTYPKNATYPDGEPIGNHAKTVIVDDAIFIIGSQNMYSCNLNEFGYIVEDATAAQAYVTSYWTPLWEYSKGTRTTVIDYDTVVSELVEAASFVNDSLLNPMMRSAWNALSDLYNAVVGLDLKQAIELRMDELIGGYGYFTNATDVLRALTQPQSPATPEALRFVANILNDKDLMTGFNDVIMKSYLSVDAANAAMNSFLTSKGYKCTAQEAFAAFASMRNDVIAYWQGVYTGWVVNDKGGTYANTTTPTPAAQPHALQARAATADPLPELGPVLKVNGNTITLDDVAIVKYAFTNNVLTWKNTDGNATSGSVQFGTVLRQTITDTFTGDEFFGTITYPDGATRHGVYSYYGRVTGDVGDSGSPDRKNYTLFYVLGAIGVAALLGLLVLYKWRSAQQQNDAYENWRDFNRRQRAERDGGRGTEPENAGAEVREGSFGKIGQEVSRRRGFKLRDSLTDAEELVPMMNQKQAVGLQKNARKLSDSVDLVEGRTVEGEPLITSVRQANTGMDDVQVGMDDVLTSFSSRMSSATRKSMTENNRVSEEIGGVFDSLYEQSQKGEEFTFGEEGERILEF